MDNFTPSTPTTPISRIGKIPTPKFIDPILIEYPLGEHVPQVTRYVRKFYVDIADYVRTPLGTPSPDLAGYVLVSESKPSQVAPRSSRGEFERIYVKAPFINADPAVYATKSAAEKLAALWAGEITVDFQTLSVQYPGFWSPHMPYAKWHWDGSAWVEGGIPSWRRPFQRLSTATVKVAFFHTTDPKTDIPLQNQFRCEWLAGNKTVRCQGNVQATVSSNIESLVLGNMTYTDGGGGIVTAPATVVKYWAKQDENTGMGISSGLGATVDSYKAATIMIGKDSEIEHFAGNIWIVRNFYLTPL